MLWLKLSYVSKGGGGAQVGAGWRGVIMLWLKLSYVSKWGAQVGAGWRGVIMLWLKLSYVSKGGGGRRLAQVDGVLLCCD